jgi:dTDP-4-amino-4,6-dideoxygalactose transaminase
MDSEECVMIKLSKPYITEKCIENVVEVLRSGNLVQGENVNKLEEEICSYLGIKYAVAVSNGTAALHLALLALGIGPGDEVIVPAFTFPATANVVELVGAKSIFIDINLEDFCINTSLIEQAITSKTKAIIPVHEFGQSAQMDKLVEIAKKHKLKVIEDAACALGSEFNNQKVGTFGDIGCFSLHPRKAITSGEGGFIVTDNADIVKMLRVLRNHGIEHANGSMDFVQAGFNYRLTDFQAALCLPQLQIIEEIIKNRKEQADIYDQKLNTVAGILIPQLFSSRRMVYQTYHIVLDKNINRNNLIKYLKENSVETNYGAQALNTLTYFSRKYNYLPGDFPNAVIANTQGLALPLGMHIQKSDLEIVTDTLIKFIRSGGV